ncbi:hypothetical protein I4U23_026908 [Adineta vaga]|nr:hypothetical protein I4U23_026908 [Adineta vaga]
MSKSSRIFSFGLGQSPSRSLVKGLARSTNGRFCFIPPSTKVDTYVGQQLEKALQPSITNLELKWNLPNEITTAPKILPPVYANDRLIVYGLINDPSIQFDHNIQIELFNNQQKLTEAKITQIPNIIQNQTISRLAGKALILELQHSKLPPSPRKGSTQARFQELNQQDQKSVDERKEEQKKRIIDLSLKYHILSPYTSFVGIEKRLNGNNDQMVLREVPIQISADVQHLQTARFPMCARRSAVDVKCRKTAMPTSKIKTFFRPIAPYSSADSLDYSIKKSCAAPRSMNSLSSTASARSERLQIEIENAMDEDDKEFPTDDENIVRYLIDKQNFDGVWNIDSETIQKLTGKPLNQFQYSIQKELIISIIIIILLETRFSSYSSMCHGIVQKSKKRILDLLNKDQNRFQSLFDDIRKQL